MQYKIYARMRYVYLNEHNPDELQRLIDSGQLEKHLLDVQNSAKAIHRKHRADLRGLSEEELSDAVSKYHRDTMIEIIDTLINI